MLFKRLYSIPDNNDSHINVSFSYIKKLQQNISSLGWNCGFSSQSSASVEKQLPHKCGNPSLIPDTHKEKDSTKWSSDLQTYWSLNMCVHTL